MRGFWTRLLSALLIVAALWLASASCNAAGENKIPTDQLAQNVVDRILAVLPESKARDIGDFKKMKGLFQWYGQMGQLGRRTRQLFSGEATVARWLANVPCSRVVSASELWQNESKALRSGGSCSFWECLGGCRQVQLAWTDRSARMLLHLLRARGPWTQTHALLSVSQRSWSLMDATDLSKLLLPEAQKRLPKCASAPPNPRRDGLLSVLEYGTMRVDGVVDEMASSAPKFGIEQLHIDLDGGGRQSRFWEKKVIFWRKASVRIGKPLRNVLQHDRFEKLATLLAGAPFLRDVSISWDAARVNPEMDQLASAFGAILSESTSVKKLSLLRTCYAGLRRQGPSPLAALINAPNAGWRNVESLTFVKHHCAELGVQTIYELEAFPVLAARMPALRRVHLEFHDRFMGTGLFRALGDLARLVPDGVVVTAANNQGDFAGVWRAATLAPLHGISSNGLAMVISAPDTVACAPGVDYVHMPAHQMLLVGNETLRDIAALTVVPSYVKDATLSRLAAIPSFEKLAGHLPRLERLAIDSRWTESFSNKHVTALPLQVVGRLRALLLHTIAFVWDGENCAACEALERLLQAGHDISVVDLGIALPSPFGRKDALILENIAVTLRRMPLLEDVSLTLAVAGDLDGIRISALRARFLEILPFARFSTSLIASGPRAMEQEIDHNGLSIGWRLNISAPVPPSPAFPSPRQVFAKS